MVDTLLLKEQTFGTFLYDIHNFQNGRLAIFKRVYHSWNDIQYYTYILKHHLNKLENMK